MVAEGPGQAVTARRLANLVPDAVRMHQWCQLQVATRRAPKSRTHRTRRWRVRRVPSGWGSVCHVEPRRLSTIVLLPTRTILKPPGRISLDKAVHARGRM